MDGDDDVQYRWFDALPTLTWCSILGILDHCAAKQMPP